MDEFGPIGYIQYLVRKTAFTYSDGTFNVGGEGQSLPPTDESQYPNPYGSVSQSLRDIYYSEVPLKYIEKLAWAIVLLLLPLSYGLFRSARSDKDKLVVLFLMMSFAGLWLFLMLFESRSRYLFSFVPLLCLTSTCGIAYLDDLLGKVPRRMPHEQHLPTPTEARNIRVLD